MLELDRAGAGRRGDGRVSVRRLVIVCVLVVVHVLSRRLVRRLVMVVQSRHPRPGVVPASAGGAHLRPPPPT
jgi:hypothetical protein